MSKYYLNFRVLYSRSVRLLFLSVVGLCLISVLSLLVSSISQVSALTSSTINYQARLLQSNGAITPDGNYNVDFKLYSTLSTGGGQAVGTCTSVSGYTCEWEENYTGANVVTVKDGYLTVNLGSITSFPTTINWANQQYLTMNIGGTGTPSWDGEMTPRIQLTSVPYAFQANSAVTASTLTTVSGAYTDTLQIAAPGGSSSDVITVPDQVGGGTVCLQNATACGFATGSGTAILQNGNTLAATVNIGANDSNNVVFRNNSTTGAAVETLTGSNGAATFQNYSNSTSGFKVNNASSAALLTVDTSNSQVIIGNQTANAGKIVLADGTNTNAVSLSASGSTANYSLTLPSTNPTANLCLESGPTGSTGNLQFSSCYNTSPTVSAAGGSWSGTATSGTTVTGGTLSTVAPTNLGDLLVVTTSMPASAGTVSSISGGGVTTWVKAIASPAAGTSLRVETWFGEVTATGTNALTLTHSTTITSGTEEVNVTEFTATGISTSSNWGVDYAAAHTSTSNTSTLTMATLNPGQTGELYYGFANDQSVGLGSGGSCNNTPSTGWTCGVSAGGQNNVADYNVSTSAGTNYIGGVNLGSSSVNYNSVAIDFVAYLSSTAINNSISTQQGNFNVQASTSGTVAGTLQANASGSGDILDLLNGSGVNVASFSSVGVATLQASGTSTGAFQVNNTASASLLAVDNSGNQVVLGNSTANAGKLIFDSGGTYNVSLAAPTSGLSSNVSLILPTSNPSANLCLESGPTGSASQLQFTSCYNTSPTVSATGGSWSGTASSGTTVTGGTLNAVAPTNLGDMLVVTTSLSASAGTVTGISGGGVTTWTKALASAAAGTSLRVETWFGTVTATGTHALTLTHSTTQSAGTTEVDVTEFTATGISTSSNWGVDYAAVHTSTTNTSTLTMASINPGQTGELYYGFANDQSVGLGTGGSCNNTPSSGWTCGVSAGGQSNVADYNVGTTAGTAYNGGVTLGSSSVNYNSVAVTFVAFISSTAINNATSTQSGNFNVQASVSGTVAGILQANAAGTGDILDLLNGSGAVVGSVSSTGNQVIAPSTNSTTALQVENSGGAASIVTVDTMNDKLILNSTVSGSSGFQFTQLTSSSTASSSFSQLLGVDSSGNVGLSTAGIALTSPALAYWDGLNNPTTGSQSYPLATITGSHTAYSSGNGVQLTDVSTTNESGSINWNFSQVPFEEIQYQFKAGGGTGADSTWFYGYADSTPTTEYGTGFTKGYIVYFSEYHGCIGIAYGSFTDGNQCGSGGGANPLASVAEANIGNNAWHDVDIQIKFNVITVRWDGVAVLTYSDIYTRDLSALNFGFGSRTGGSTNYHYIKGLVVTKLGNLAGDFGIDGVSPIIGTLNWDSTNSYLGVNVAAPTATIDVSGTSLFTGSASTTGFVVQNASSVSLLTVDTSNNSVIIGSGSSGDMVGYNLILDNKSTTGDPTEVDGAMYYNSFIDDFRCGTAGVWQNCAGSLVSNSAVATDASCTTLCAAFAHASLGATYCSPGRNIRILINGVWGTAASIPTISLGIYYGTSATRTSDTLIGIASPTFTAGTQPTAQGWSLDYNINCFTAGTSGTIMGQGHVDWGTSANALTREWMQQTGTTTMNTTIAQNIYVFPIWGTSNGSNTITADTVSITSN